MSSSSPPRTAPASAVRIRRAPEEEAGAREEPPSTPRRLDRMVPVAALAGQFRSPGGPASQPPPSLPSGKHSESSAWKRHRGGVWSDQLRRVAAREEMDLSLLDRSAFGHDQSGQAHSVRIDHVQAEGSLLFAWCTSLETGPVSSVDDSPELFVCLVGGRADDLGPGARISLQRPWREVVVPLEPGGRGYSVLLCRRFARVSAPDAPPVLARAPVNVLGRLLHGYGSADIAAVAAEAGGPSRPTAATTQSPPASLASATAATAVPGWWVLRDVQPSTTVDALAQRHSARGLPITLALAQVDALDTGQAPAAETGAVLHLWPATLAMHPELRAPLAELLGAAHGRRVRVCGVHATARRCRPQRSVRCNFRGLSQAQVELTIADDGTFQVVQDDN